MMEMMTDKAAGGIKELIQVKCSGQRLTLDQCSAFPETGLSTPPDGTLHGVPLTTVKPEKSGGHGFGL